MDVTDHDLRPYFEVIFTLKMAFCSPEMQIFMKTVHTIFTAVKKEALPPKNHILLLQLYFLCIYQAHKLRMHLDYRNEIGPPY